MTTDITELAQREKFEAWWERTQHNGNPPRFGWEYWREGEGYKVDDDDSELDGMWEVWKAASAELVEALESEKRICATWRKTAEANSEKLEKAQQRLAELESSGVAPGILRCTECSFVLTKNIISVTADTITTVESESEPCPNGCGQLLPATWKALAIHLMFTTKQGVSDLLEAKKRIAELESRTVTVKLTDINEYLAEVHDKTLNRAFRLLAEGVRAGDVAAMRASGINVEAE